MTNGQIQLLTIILGALGIIFIPLFALMVRIIIKWTRAESTLGQLAIDLRELVVDKDKTHNEIVTTMREDRAATDRRLRWLEEHYWKGRE